MTIEQQKALSRGRTDAFNYNELAYDPDQVEAFTVFHKKRKDATGPLALADILV